MRLDDFLLQNDLSLNEFARRIGVDPATVHRIKNETVTPHRRTMKLIHEATAGQVCPNDLLQLFPPAQEAVTEAKHGSE